MIRLIPIALVMLGVFAAMWWLMRYSTRDDVGNGGHFKSSVVPWAGFSVDSTVSAYARRSWEMAREASRHASELLALATRQRTEQREQQKTETRTGG